ncbi:MAG TPA: diguanylate cyclase [Candidatus Deferrimicrobiaceae bacterium]
MPEHRLLLVDDSETVRDMLAFVLAESGLEVETAATGIEALRAAFRSLPDMILMNIRLPGMNGAQACRVLKADPATRDIPVVLVSTEEGGTAKFHASRSGADRVLLKDVNPEDIVQVVSDCLESRPPGAPPPAPPDAEMSDAEILSRANHYLDGKLFEATLFNEIGRVGQDVDDFEMMLRMMGRLVREIAPHEVMAAVFTDTVTLETVIAYPFAVDDAAREGVRGWMERIREEAQVPCSPESVMVSEFRLNERREEEEDGGAADEPLRPVTRVLIRSGDMVKGLVVLFSRAPENSLGERGLTEALLRQSFTVMENAWLYRQIIRMSTTDGLTALTNVRAFRESLKREHSRAIRHRQRYSIIMMDIDHFKKVNDVYGHPVGDAVLRDLAALIREGFRTTDFPARYGGEEFIVLLPETSKREAQVVAERLRVAVERKVFAAPSPSLHATISMGITDFDPESPMTEKEVIAVADDALYHSKREGRNRITLR